MRKNGFISVSSEILHGCETWSQILRDEHTEGISEQSAENNIWTEEE
jgi:hypothetical protein